MRLRPEHAHALLPGIDPGRLRSGRPVGLRDGALLALVAAGLSAFEIARLHAAAITMERGSLLVRVHRDGVAWSVTLPTDLGARLLAWLTERRLWAADVPVFIGRRGPLSRYAVYKLLERYGNRQLERRRRR